MGTLVICFYRPHAGHVPLLRDYGLITDRPLIQGVA